MRTKFYLAAGLLILPLLLASSYPANKHRWKQSIDSKYEVKGKITFYTARWELRNEMNSAHPCLGGVGISYWNTDTKKLIIKAWIRKDWCEKDFLSLRPAMDWVERNTR
jgi:hypothetical protein